MEGISISPALGKKSKDERAVLARSGSLDRGADLHVVWVGG